ncbi:hypothetical protein DTO166G4_1808 [Paecilomyces variotii]|nr:hypothetical protein DTO166G4_1808 [Paecilomyces variotii]KAJ9239564.1 hypothetical protein DTO166G5_2311 [Paecilomyces variotii]KAJ9251426.1 hypothetical protein DTO195F2_7815 [Paecilomyces variotii]KAJ9355818.1 hypothetical protein DTO027B9_3972 [Paecilomyces variotii]KAJ9374729.1 hypothetical protein DTO282E5_812 [Paecilomyces variotii]
MSLEAHAVQAALDAEVTGTKLIGNYPSEEQIAVSRGVPREEAYDAGFEKGEEADIFAELRKYLQLMHTQPMSSWDAEDRRKADLSFIQESVPICYKLNLPQYFPHYIHE